MSAKKNKPVLPPPRIEHEPDAAWIPLGGRFFIPSRFYATFMVADVVPPQAAGIEVDATDGAPRIVALTIRDERGVTGALLRAARLPDLLRAAIEAASYKVEFGADGKPRFFRAYGSGDPSTPREDRVAEFQDAYSRARRQGVPVDEEHLRRVAEVYRAAVARGEAPTKAVSRELFASRSTAGRWVMQARKRGFLRPALGRIGGEARPNKKEE
jgi:hypothetical protein